MTSSLPIKTATVDLTPLATVPMGGFSGPTRVTRHTHGRLEANIVALGTAGDTIVLIALDTLFAGASLTARLVDACADRFGIAAERVLVLASHTHFAPMLDGSKPALGETDTVELDRWRNAIADALDTMDESTATSVRVSQGLSDAAVNRRLRWRFPTVIRLIGKTKGDVYLCDNPAGPRDPRIRTCVWLSEQGRPLAALWSFACHPVGFPESDTASADFIGTVREALRAKLGAGLPIVFAPGCMGDVWPRSPGPWNTVRRIPLTLLYGPSAPAFDRPAWDEWAGRLADEVVTIDAAGVGRSINSTPRAAEMSRTPMRALFDGITPVPEFHAKAVQVPGLGRIVALSCEPVTTIAGLFAETNEDLVLGYEGDVFGYLPTDAIIAEGGYEGWRFMRVFGLRGAFRAQLDSRIAHIAEAMRS